jgi:hypothetical protein
MDPNKHQDQQQDDQRNRSRDPERSRDSGRSREDSGGITNRSMEEERLEQERLPDRGQSQSER